MRCRRDIKSATRRAEHSLGTLIEGNPLDVVFNLIRMTPAVYKNVLDAGTGEELESIFDQRGIGKRKETLEG